MSNYSRPGPEHPNGVALGGIGTGRIELGSNGRIELAGITNNWQRLLAGLEGTFFFLRVETLSATTFHLLEALGYGRPGLPGVAVDYRGCHPVADVNYRLEGSPVEVALTAFSPLIPHDFDASSVPGAAFSFRFTNAGSEPARVRFGFSWEHLLGCGGAGRRGLALACDRTGNTIEPWTGAGSVGLRFEGGSEAQLPNARGEMVLAVRPGTDARVWAFRTWNVLSDRAAVLAALAAGLEPGRFDGGPFAAVAEAARARREHPPSWDDPDPRFGGGRTGIEGAIHPAGILGVEFELEPGRGAVEIPFALAWHTPEHRALDQPGIDHGHGYCARFSDAGAVAEALLDNRPDWLERTRGLHQFVRGTDVPGWMADKVLNDHVAVTTNSIVTRAGDLFTLEASPMMFGALGTLDQRLVSHPGFSWFYPDLNRTELRTFARLQAEDGSLPHFNGNAHTALGTDAVEYGRTGWPDLACSFIVQSYRDWRDTGDPGFFDEMRPVIARAARWLCAADRDGDGIPEGGSSWDIEHYPGCFIATATVWMATLRILEDVAHRSGDAAAAADFAARLARAAATVDGMWDGHSYLKCFDPVTGRRSDDVFVGQLAGEWIVRQLGLAPVLPEARVRAALATIYRLHGDRSRYRLMPIQVRPDGSLPERKYAWHAWPQYSLVFVDCLALSLGMCAPALESVAAFDAVVRDVNRTPWATTLWHDARTGLPDFESFMGRDWYMNTTASWWLLPALAGFAADEPARSIVLGPTANVPGAEARGRLPIITPRYWAVLEVERDGGRLRATLRVERLFRGECLELRTVRWRGPVAAATVDGAAAALESWCGGSVLVFPEPVRLGEGGSVVLALDGVPAEDAGS